MTGTRTHKTWVMMMQRCTNPRYTNFGRYGGRGITVCQRWRVFENFLADMGVRPAGLTLDRINNDGHYEPGNLRWAPRRRQANNTQRSVIGEWDYYADEWPYTYLTVRQLLLKGLTRREILKRAAIAVKEKHRHWRTIAARLASLTS